MGDHTPGPWKVSVWANNTGYGGQPSGVYIEDEYGSELEVCTFDCPYDLGQGEAESNARLIARAPDLLAENAALRAKVERLEGEKLRLREVVKSVEHSERVNPLNGERYKACPSCWQAEPQHFTDCQLAAVLRETEVDTNQGESDA